MLVQIAVGDEGQNAQGEQFECDRRQEERGKNGDENDGFAIGELGFSREKLVEQS
jgi:hypothetical protein